MNKYIYTTILSTFLLSACSSNGPLVHSWGDYGDSAKTNGIYMVEAPYEIKGVWYYPAEQYDYAEQGLASWYMPSGDGALTTNGEVYDVNMPTARHKTLPLPSIVRVTNLENNRAVVVRVNDRGPMVNNRLIDVSQAAAKELGMPASGTVMVKVEVLPEESKLAKSQLMGTESPYPQTVQVTEEQVKEDEKLTLIEPQKEEKESDVMPILYEPEQPAVQTEVVPVQSVPEVEKSVEKPVAQVMGTSVVLGSFGNPENAQKLKAKLANQYPVYVDQVERNGRVLSVVKVGPFNADVSTEVMSQLKKEGYRDAYLAK
mgnify:CR=1 FL=1